MKMNNHFMEGSQRFDTGFIDSGATLTKFHIDLFKIITGHFSWFCEADPENNCKGALLGPDFDSTYPLCFSYNETEFIMGPRKYFASFPILRFLLKTENSEEP